MQADKLHARGIYGSGVKWGIVDSGYIEHPDLLKLPQTQIVTVEFPDPTDNNGHGTHARGIVEMQVNDAGFIGIAPKGIPHIAKGLGGDGSGSPYFIAKCIDILVEKGCKVINLSLGSDSDSPELTKAINNAFDNGCLCVCAAGNSGGKVIHPARLSKAVAVAAVDGNKVVADFSCKGKEIDVAAPGVGILSTWIDGEYRPATGTSMAAPHVTGILVLFCEMFNNEHKRFPTPQEMIDYLHANAQDLGIEGIDTESGYGLALAIDINGQEQKPLTEKCTLLNLLKRIFS